jgi:hypothetical protein
MTSASFTKLATVSASTKRNPAPSSGKVGALATNLSSLSCTPLYPVSDETANRFGLENPFEYKETFVQGGLDIKKGDYLVIGSEQYPIRFMESWAWPPDGVARLRLVVEDIDI